MMKTIIIMVAVTSLLIGMVIGSIMFPTVEIIEPETTDTDIQDTNFVIDNSLFYARFCSWYKFCYMLEQKGEK